MKDDRNISHPPGWKSAEDYEFLEMHSAVNKVSHSVELHEKIKNQKTWFMKYFAPEKYDIAQREVYAQELFRVFIPNHPKYRIMLDNRDDMYVISKGVSDFYSFATRSGVFLGDDFHYGVLSGKYKNMGEVMVMSLLMNEIDLKIGNMGVDGSNQVVKIDGDWCFAAARLKGNYAITEDVINRLPDPGHYQPHNWYIYYKAGIAQDISDIRTKELNSPEFRNEVNSALLKAILLPDEVFIRLAHHHMQPELADQSANIMLERRKQLQESALRNESFLEFLQSDQAFTVHNEFFAYLSECKMTDKTPMVSVWDIETMDNVFLQLKGNIYFQCVSNLEADKFLLSAVRDDSIEKVDHQLKNNPDCDPNIHMKYTRGLTPLHVAVFNNQIEIVKRLLEEPNINVNIQTEDGKTALHLAAINGRFEMIALLLKAPNANLNIQDDIGDTVLHLILDVNLDEDRRKAVYLLCDCGADRDCQNNAGITPLHFAAGEDDLDVIQRLITEKNINLATENGSTPLHMAAHDKKMGVVKLLLNQGADPLIKDKKDRLAMNVAKSKEIKAVLRSAIMKSFSKSNFKK